MCADAQRSALALVAGQALSARGARSRKSVVRGSEEGDAGILQNPWHRKCLTCLRFADDPGPVLSSDAGKVCMQLGKPPNPAGQTMGLYCFYCTRFYTGRIRGIPGTTQKHCADEFGHFGGQVAQAHGASGRDDPQDQRYMGAGLTSISISTTSSRRRCRSSTLSSPPC